MRTVEYNKRLQRKILKNSLYGSVNGMDLNQLHRKLRRRIKILSITNKIKEL
jgi:hypothetical protein